MGTAPREVTGQRRMKEKREREGKGRDEREGKGRGEE